MPPGTLGWPPGASLDKGRLSLWPVLHLDQSPDASWRQLKKTITCLMITWKSISMIIQVQHKQAMDWQEVILQLLRGTQHIKLPPLHTPISEAQASLFAGMQARCAPSDSHPRPKAAMAVRWEMSQRLGGSKEPPSCHQKPARLNISLGKNRVAEVKKSGSVRFLTCE